MNILLVEDDNAHAQLIERRFAQQPDQITVLRAATVRRARELLQSRRFHVVLVDFSLPDGDGLDLFTEIHARFSNLPVIFLTAADSAEVCARALKGGAVDYVVKKRNYLDNLPTVVRKACRAPVNAVTQPGAAITRDVPADILQQVAPPPPEDADECTRIRVALERNRWNRTRAARDLGLSRVTLWRRMWTYNLYRDHEAKPPDS